jgi:cell division protein FtsN
VQLGSFTLKNYADDRKADAEKAGFEVVIVETTGPDGDVIYKVLSPTLKVRSQADEQLAKFKAAGFDQAFLVRTTK